MADVRKIAARQIITKQISDSVNISVVSNVKCVRLNRIKNGFGFTLKYCFSYAMKVEMDEDEKDDASGSDADISSDGSDTPCSQRPNNSPERIEKVFIQRVMPSSPADQAGLMQGDEVISINNLAVYGGQESEIENFIQNSGTIDLDVVQKDVRRGNKEGMFRYPRSNGHDGYSSNHEEASDNGSSLSLTSCSSGNGTSPSSLSPPVQTDRCFVVTCGTLREPEPKPVQMRSFPFPPSSSDEEPQMENKSVGFSVSEIEAHLVDVERAVTIQRQQVVCNSKTLVTSIQDRPEYEDGVTSKPFGLTSSTTSSVLVESLDSCSKSNQPSCVTVTTATYGTLASPQFTRGESGYGSKEDGSDTSDNRLTVPLIHGDNSIWELRSSRPSHVRSRSPSPAQRRVSYLMATEGNSSLSSGNWVVKCVVNGETSSSLVPLKEESSENLSRVTCQYQGGSDADVDTTAQQDQYILATPTSSEPVVFRTSEKGDGDEVSGEQSEFSVEEKRHSLKRKCSVENVVEVEKEGFLSRKLGASHGRRSWKQVYVVLNAHVLYIYKDKPDQMVNAGQDEKPISIKSCIVDIASDYRKRENVFRLTTYNGSQYLFQAKDKDSMMSWITAIQKNNNPDEDKSGVNIENLIVRRKKNMDNEISSGQTPSKQMPPVSLKISGLKKSLSFKSNSGSQSSFKNSKKAVDGDTKATWHNKVVNKMKKISGTSSPIPQYQIPGYSVGLPLERCSMSKNNPSLPLLVEHCCQVVENKGLESVGIYRVPGNSASVAALEEELNAKTPDTIDFEEQKWNDANNMGSLLKKFLRKLPEGLVTSELYSNFIEANRKEGEQRMWALKHLIQQLPSTYGETLRFLIKHLKEVSEHSDKNKMEIRNLAIVFGPTIVRTGEDNMMTMVNDMSDRFRIVESFITNFDWFFDNEPVTNGSVSPVSPPVEEFSRLLVSGSTLTSIEQAAVSYESNESNWKFKGPSIKLPNFKHFMKHGSENSKKSDLTPDQSGSLELTDNGKVSPVNLSPYNGTHRTAGGSQPNSPTTGRRKFIKRHHSTSNISTTEVHDDFDKSKSEGEDEDAIFFARAHPASRAYSYARPPPPSYRELRNKGSFKGNSQVSPPQSVTKEPAVFPEAGEAPDFNSLSEETKRRLLRVTLAKKVNEKKMQKTTEENSVDLANQGVTNPSFVEDNETKGVANSSTIQDSASEQSVVFEPQLKASEAKKRFESFSESNRKASAPTPDKQSIGDSVPQLRRREGPAPSSSSRNFKIYSNAEVNFSQYRPSQINEWVQDMGQNKSSADQKVEESGGGRGRVKKDEELAGKRSGSVSGSLLVQDDQDMVVERRSSPYQSVNLEDDNTLDRTRTFSRSSDSSDSSDEEVDPFYASSASFDEKLRGLLQKNKLEDKSKTEIQPARKFSQVSRPPSTRVSRSSVDKMRAIDPSSKIQSGAVSSMKSLFESGVAHYHSTKSRSSSLSSTSSGSILSNDTQRRKSTCSSNTLSDADVKRRVWETDSATGEKRKQWKEPVWVAKERAMKNLKSESESSLQEPSDDNNNVFKNNEKTHPVSKLQYSRSVSLPLKQNEYPVRNVVAEPRTPDRKTEPIFKANTEQTLNCQSTIEPLQNERIPVKTVTRVKNIASPKASVPTASVHYKTAASTESVDSNEKTNVRPHATVHATKSMPSESDSNVQKQKSMARSRRRIVSDSPHRGVPTGRTFTAPILGTVVTTTTAFELEGFAITPARTNRNSKGRSQRKLEKHDIGVSEISHAADVNNTLNVPTISHPGYGSPRIRRKGTLPVPEVDDAKRLSTDRKILERNALHIKELLDEMNTEHSLKMERQKSDTISIDAQKSARKRAMRRRLSLGQDRENGVVVASCVSASNGMKDCGRKDSTTPLSTSNNDLKRNVSTVKWVGVSS